MTTENTHDDAACVNLYCDTLARLNEISTNQMQSILDIAIAAADAANSIAPSNTDAEAFLERVTALIDSLNSEAEALDGDMGTGGRPAPGHSSTTGGGDAFCEAVESDINTAIENSLSNQQQLYVTGAAVLAEGANLVLNAATPADTGST
jgi:hypothetical protein